MSIHEISQPDFKSFFENGGKITFKIDESDLPLDKEGQKNLGENLYTGFDYKMPSFTPKLSVNIPNFHDTWGVIEYYIYTYGGSITYKKNNNFYEVAIDLPHHVVDRKVFLAKQRYAEKGNGNPTKVYLTKIEESELITHEKCDAVSGPKGSFQKLQGLDIVWDSKEFKVE